MNRFARSFTRRNDLDVRSAFRRTAIVGQASERYPRDAAPARRREVQVTIALGERRLLEKRRSARFAGAFWPSRGPP
jgi:hypothetical protein